jgi:hypothetical protein
MCRRQARLAGSNARVKALPVAADAGHALSFVGAQAATRHSPRDASDAATLDFSRLPPRPGCDTPT